MSNQHLNGSPIDWSVGDKHFKLPPADIDFELNFQNAHEAWARARLQASKTTLTLDAWMTDLEVFQSRRDSNEFAWRSLTSWRWLNSRPGQIEYLFLKAKAGFRLGGDGTDKDEITRFQKDCKESWNDIFTQCLRQDFPDFFQEAEREAKKETKA